MVKKNTIPTILGVIILILGAFAGVFFLKSSTTFKIGADAAAAPKNIRVANITDSSATISWTTDKATVNFLLWGTAAASVTKTENEDSSGAKFFSHSITLTGLAANTTYFYKINSDGATYDNSGTAWQFKTGASLGSVKNSLLMSGSVINASGTPEKRALVYADIGGYLLSTQTSDTGNYVFQLASARTTDLQAYAEVEPSQTLVQISVQATPTGISSAQIYPQSGNPVPPMIIGQTYDFKNEPVNNAGDIPDADLNLPQDEEKQSKFNVTVPDETPKPTSVILESLADGEVITSTQPQFFGKGPEGVQLVIEVHSEESIKANVNIPESGSWSYEVPTDLAPGEHTITISWVDLSGITRFLTRNFVVKAGEIPAFTASQSGSTATPSPTTVASGSPTPVPSVTASPTLSPTATPTALPVPVTGDLTPTLLLFIMGLVITSFSFIVWKVAEN
jgi:hypothetical protein